MKSITLLMLVDVFQALRGGAERQITETCKHINKEKFRIIVACLSEKDAALKEIKDFGIETKTLGVSRIYDAYGLMQGIKFFRFLKKEKVDILMTYHFGSDIWGSFFGKLAGVPVVISNRRDVGFWRKGIHGFMYRLIKPFVDMALGNSQAVMDVIIKQDGFPKDKTRLFYNGIDFDRFRNLKDAQSIKESLQIQNKNPIFGCVGHLTPVKGLMNVIEVLPKIKHVFPNVALLLIGSGEQEAELRLKAKELDVESNVLFLDRRNDIPELLSVMDICVLPSLSEGFSNALLEYMAAEKPIVATAVGGNVDVIEHEKNGLLVPPKDSNALAEAILRLLQDKNFADQLAKNARKTVEERFDMKKQIREFEDFLSSVCGKRVAVCDDAQRAPHNAQRGIKVLHLISSSGLFGAEKVLLELVKQQSKQGIALCVGVFNNKHNPHLEIADEIKKLGIEVVIFDCAGRFDFKAVAEMRKFIKEKEIDIIHSHGYKSNFYAWLATWFLKTRRVATCHGRTEKPGVKIYQLFDSFVLGRFQKAAVVSEVLREKLVKSRIKADKLVLISNGIDISTFTVAPSQQAISALRQEFKLSPHSKVIVIIGRLSPEKGHRYLFQALQNVRRRLPEIKCLIVGGGESEQELRIAVNDLGLSNYVIFAGIRNNIPEILTIADVFVMSSLTEGMPISLLEAMAAKVPVIATKVGQIPRIIEDGKSGVLVEPKDSSTLADAIFEILHNKEKAKQLAENAFSKVQQEFSSEKMAEKYRNIYDSLASSVKRIASSNLAYSVERLAVSEKELNASRYTLSANQSKVVLIEIAGKGGICHYTYNLAQSLSTHTEVFVATGEDYEFDNMPKNFSVFRVFNRLKTNPFRVLWLVRRCAQSDIGTVHFQVSQYPAFVLMLCYLIKIFAHKKIILTAHNVVAHEQKKWEEGVYKKLYRLADAIIVHAEVNKKEMIDSFGLGKNKIEVIPHGNYTFFNTDAISTPLNGDATVLFFGYIRRYKGLMYLIRAMKLVKERVPQARLIIAGKAVEDFKEYQDAIEELNLNENIEKHLDYIGFDQTQKFFNRANVVAMPYENIYQSGVVQVAYGFARPVVVTNVGGFPEAVEEGKSGFIVEPRDVEALAEKITLLLKDRELQKKMGEYGLFLARTKFSWESIARRTLEVYGAL